MNYWFTIHWPQFDKEKNIRIPEIEIQEHPDNLGYLSSLKKGDLVFVYGTKGGQPSKVGNKTYRRPTEKKNGIKAIYTVASDGWLRRNELGIRYGMWYATMAETDYHGNVPKEKANEILGYKKEEQLPPHWPGWMRLKTYNKRTG